MPFGPVFLVLEFELRTSVLLGRSSTTWATCWQLDVCLFLFFGWGDFVTAFILLIIIFLHRFSNSSWLDFDGYLFFRFSSLLAYSWIILCYRSWVITLYFCAVSYNVSFYLISNIIYLSLLIFLVHLRVCYSFQKDGSFGEFHIFFHFSGKLLLFFCSHLEFFLLLILGFPWFGIAILGIPLLACLFQLSLYFV
jgi:hypothetical protein